MKQSRAEKVERAIRLTWSSLESHLPYAAGEKDIEKPAFHQRCVAEYAEIIKLLSELY